MCNARTYRGMHKDPANDASLNVRFNILPGDFSRLYRTHRKEHLGVDSDERSVTNVDEWLNPHSPKYKPHVAESVFYYRPRGEGDTSGNT